MRWSGSRIAAVLSACILVAGIAFLLTPQPLTVDTVKAARGPLEVTTSEEGESRSKERALCCHGAGRRQAHAAVGNA